MKQKEPDSSFWLSQVNPFHGINEEKIPRDSAAYLCRAGEWTEGGGEFWGHGGDWCWERATLSSCPCCKSPGHAQGSALSWNHGISAGRILPTRITECWLCSGHPNNPTKSAQRLLLKLFQRPPSVKVTSCSKHLPLTWSLQCITSRHTCIQPILLEFCLWRQPTFAPWGSLSYFGDEGSSSIQTMGNPSIGWLLGLPRVAVLEKRKIGCFGMRNLWLSPSALFSLIQWVGEAKAQLKSSSSKVKVSGRKKYFQLEEIFPSQGIDLK